MLAIQVQVSQFTRILVVAPSNAAVDEIVRRVMDKGFVDQSDASLRYVSVSNLARWTFKFSVEFEGV